MAKPMVVTITEGSLSQEVGAVVITSVLAVEKSTLTEIIALDASNKHGLWLL